jgi:hypothetical protein
MAPPIYPGVFRAQVILQGTSGLPEDRYVNVYHFMQNNQSTATPAGPLGELSAELVRRLGAVYTGVPTGGPQKLTDYLSSRISGMEIRVYDLGTPGPRETVAAPVALPPVTARQSMPEEVALCGSFYATRNIPTRRGRVFIGPFHVEALAAGPSAPRPVIQLRETLANALKDLASEGVGDRLDWAVLSPTNGNAQRITDVWVDNAWDTIRARGSAADARTSRSAA